MGRGYLNKPRVGRVDVHRQQLVGRQVGERRLVCRHDSPIRAKLELVRQDVAEIALDGNLIDRGQGVEKDLTEGQMTASDMARSCIAERSNLARGLPSKLGGTRPAPYILFS